MRPLVASLLVVIFAALVLVGCIGPFQPDEDTVAKWLERILQFEAIVDAADAYIEPKLCPEGQEPDERCQEYRAIVVSVRLALEQMREILEDWSVGRLDEGIAKSLLKAKRDQVEETLKRLRMVTAAAGLSVAELDVKP